MDRQAIVQRRAAGLGDDGRPSGEWIDLGTIAVAVVEREAGEARGEGQVELPRRRLELWTHYRLDWQPRPQDRALLLLRSGAAIELEVDLDAVVPIGRRQRLRLGGWGRVPALPGAALFRVSGCDASLTPLPTTGLRALDGQDWLLGPVLNLGGWTWDGSALTVPPSLRARPAVMSFAVAADDGPATIGNRLAAELQRRPAGGEWSAAAAADALYRERDGAARATAAGEARAVLADGEQWRLAVGVREDVAPSLGSGLRPAPECRFEVRAP